jgi:hypothetical protein
LAERRRQSFFAGVSAALLFPQTNEGQRLLYLCAQHPFYYTNLLHTYAPAKKTTTPQEIYIFSLLYRLLAVVGGAVEFPAAEMLWKLWHH